VLIPLSRRLLPLCSALGLATVAPVLVVPERVSLSVFDGDGNDGVVACGHHSPPLRGCLAHHARGHSRPLKSISLKKKNQYGKGIKSRCYGCRTVVNVRCLTSSVATRRILAARPSEGPCWVCYTHIHECARSVVQLHGSMISACLAGV
jgi:hypothetical protein